MSTPVKFLTSLAQALATMSLYGGDHPARSRAVDAALALLGELHRENPSAEFSFLGDDVVYGQLPLYGLKDWPWSMRLASAGVQRLEFIGQPDAEEFRAFVEDVLVRVNLPANHTLQAKTPVFRTIRYGTVGIRGEDGDVISPEEIPSANIAYTLGEETGAMAWLQQQVAQDGDLSATEAQAVVRSLAVAMRCDSMLIIPLLRLKASDEYLAIHALNVAVLTMALTSYIGLGDRDVHAFGLAALLHDIGMSRMPRDLLTRPGGLTDTEMNFVRRHTVEGARIILASDRDLDVAAAVAYEHHLRPDGLGYPALRFARAPHYASSLVRVCDVYDAARTDRPHRSGMAPAQALQLIERNAGTEFDTGAAEAFVNMMSRLSDQVTEMNPLAGELLYAMDREPAVAPQAAAS
jgi:putative nucleotidyltransferase with HDIG domain